MKLLNLAIVLHALIANEYKTIAVEQRKLLHVYSIDIIGHVKKALELALLSTERCSLTTKMCVCMLVCMLVCVRECACE